MKRVLLWPFDRFTNAFEWVSDRFFGGNPLFAAVGLWLLWLSIGMVVFGNDVGLETILPITFVMALGAEIERHKYKLNHPPVTRTSARAPWRCPSCGAAANERCLTNTGAKTKFLPQMHKARWDARPKTRTKVSR